MEQKKYVTFMNAVEALNKLMAEKRLEGVMLLKNGRILFKAYNPDRKNFSIFNLQFSIFN